MPCTPPTSIQSPSDRAFDQQDDARDEVRHDVLQAETDADRQRTGDDGQARQVDAGGVDGDQRGQEDADIAHPRHQRGLPALVHAGARQDRVSQRALEQPRDHVADGEDHREQQEIRRRDAGFAKGKALAEARPKLGQVAEAGAPDQREDRQRQHRQRKAQQHRHQALAVGLVGGGRDHGPDVGQRALQHQQQRQRPSDRIAG
jgi:hypothetical protein